MASFVSLAAQRQDSLLLSGLVKAQSNPYSTRNPSGIINLGTAENKLSQARLQHKCQSLLRDLGQQDPPDWLYYGSFHGSDPLRTALADFFNRHLKPLAPLTRDHISTASGCGSVVANLVQAIVNPGEGILVPTPYYGGFDFDLCLYSLATLLPVPTEKSNNFIVSIEALEEAYQSHDKPVKMLVLTNPQNPTGTLIAPTQLLKLLNWARTRHLAVIMDEIYALSTFSTEQGSFTSALSLTLPDPENTHIVWSASKDLCLNGLRLGVLISRSRTLMPIMQRLALFTNISSLTDGLLTRLLQDHAWIDDFVRQNQALMATQYQKTIKFLNAKDIEYVPASGGFFLWINLSHLLASDPSAETERDLWERLIKAGVLISPASAFGSQAYGWYRIVFTMDWDLLRLGLERVLGV